MNRDLIAALTVPWLLLPWSYGSWWLLDHPPQALAIGISLAISGIFIKIESYN